MMKKFFTCPKHDFTRLGRVDRWLGRTLLGYLKEYPWEAESLWPLGYLKEIFDK